MAGTTPKGFRYPSSTDAPNVHTDFFNLASDVDTKLDSYQTTTVATAAYAPASTTFSKTETNDVARVVNFLLMG
jgi:hypothetical protein